MCTQLRILRTGSHAPGNLTFKTIELTTCILSLLYTRIKQDFSVELYISTLYGYD